MVARGPVGTRLRALSGCLIPARHPVFPNPSGRAAGNPCSRGAMRPFYRESAIAFPTNARRIQSDRPTTSPSFKKTLAITIAFLIIGVQLSWADEVEDSLREAVAKARTARDAAQAVIGEALDRRDEARRQADAGFAGRPQLRGKHVRPAGRWRGAPVWTRYGKVGNV